jgi:hypothetical protein
VTARPVFVLARLEGVEQEPAPIAENGPRGHSFAYTNLHYIRGLSDMLTTGNQLKAARALAGISQAQLAKAASINVTNHFGDAMEGKGAATLASGLDTIKAVMDALDVAGIELLGHGQPGCRLKAK